MFDHATDLKEGAEPPWKLIYLMSQYQLDKLKIYFDKLLHQEKITDSQSPTEASILFVPKPDDW